MVVDLGSRVGVLECLRWDFFYLDFGRFPVRNAEHIVANL